MLLQAGHSQSFRPWFSCRGRSRRLPVLESWRVRSFRWSLRGRSFRCSLRGRSSRSFFGRTTTVAPMNKPCSCFLSRCATCASGASVEPITASIFPMYWPSSSLTIIESNAGDEPVNERSSPPSWLVRSTMPRNMCLIPSCPTTMFESVGQSRRDETHPAAINPTISVANMPVAGRIPALSPPSSSSSSTSFTGSFVASRLGLAT